MICSRKKAKNNGSMHFSWFDEDDKPEVLRQIGKIKGDPIVYFYDDNTYDLGIDDTECPYSYLKQTNLHTKWCEEETRRVYGV